jgi:hypothetical protein
VIQVGLERLARLVVIGIFGAVGLAMVLVPGEFAGYLGSAGTDEFAYRSGGAAFLGYAVAFAIAWSDTAASLRILWLATIAAAGAVVVAALIAIALGGQASMVLLLVALGAALVGAIGFAGLRGGGAVLPASSGQRFATWFVAFLGWGVIASALFGLGGLILGSIFGTLTGFPGGDDTMYRLAGAATVGILVGTVLALRTQDWSLVRRPVLMSFATNLLTLIGGLIYIGHGGVPVAAYLIAAAAVFNVAGLGLAISGRR